MSSMKSNSNAFSRAWSKVIVASLITLLLSPIAAAPIKPDSQSIRASFLNDLGLCTYYIGFNLAKSPLDNLLVRKALVAAVDRQQIPQYIDEPTLPAMTFTPPGVFGHVNGFSQSVGIPYDVSQAQQWLSNAGYPGGLDFPYLQLYFVWYYDEGDRNYVPQIVQDSWYAGLGVESELMVVEYDTFIHLMTTDPPALWYFRWCTLEPDQVEADYYLYDAIETLDLAHGNWQNTTYDDLLSQAAGSSDPDQRRDLYRQAEEILVETDVVLFPLFYVGMDLGANIYLPVILNQSY